MNALPLVTHALTDVQTLKEVTCVAALVDISELDKGTVFLELASTRTSTFLVLQRRMMNQPCLLKSATSARSMGLPRKAVEGAALLEIKQKLRTIT